MFDNQNYDAEKFPFVKNFLFLFFKFVNLILIGVIAAIIIYVNSSNLPPILSYTGMLMAVLLTIGLCFQIAIQEFFKVLFAVEKNTNDTTLVLKMILEKLQENNTNDNPPPLPKA